MKRLTALLCAVAVVGAVTMAAAPAMAATTGTLGADVSWPQCSGTGTGPMPGSGSTLEAWFGIVGVNNGRPGAANPCLGTEFKWAGGLTAQAPQLYVNTADPGNTAADWPSSNTATSSNPYGLCTTVKSRGKLVGADSQACAFEYGAEQANSDLAFALNLSATTWWLDVETANTWQTRRLTDLNEADLLGMVDVFQSKSLTVGAYSTHYQWNKILGSGWQSSTAGPTLNVLAQWIPTGGNSQNTATSDCTDLAALPSFTGGTRTYVQFTATYDYDVSCLF
ncbi:MAG: hypothetical protein ACYDAQ_07675 [Mycobacteriales bacterium]